MKHPRLIAEVVLGADTKEPAVSYGLSRVASCGRSMSPRVRVGHQASQFIVPHVTPCAAKGYKHRGVQTGVRLR
jgi:hypothetical protein